MLTPEQVEHYQTFGFLLLPQAFNADEMAALTQTAEEVWREDPPPEEHGEWRLSQIVERRPALHSLATDERIYPAIQQLLGPDFIWVGSEGNISGRNEVTWHADRKYYKADEQRWIDFKQLKVMIYLQAVTRDSGCLRVIPGSHKMPYHEDLAPQEVDPDARPFGLAPQEVPCTCLEIEPGDVILFDHMIWHAAFGGGPRRCYVAMKFAIRPSAKHHLDSLKRYSAAVFQPHEAFLNHEDPRIRAMVAPLVSGATASGG